MWGNLERPPLRAAALNRVLAADGFELTVVPETRSTNADLLTAAAAGAPEGTVLVAESQTSGRGRLDRGWTSPPRAGLTFSVLLRPPAPTGWLPLLTGLALVAALRDAAGVPAGLKWPNDVLLDEETGERKVAGILAEAAAGAVVVGVGLNVTTTAAEFEGSFTAAPGALPPTSLALGRARTTDRETLLKAALRSMARAYAGWQADPASIAPLYRGACSTLGRTVRLELPGGQVAQGVATDVDVDGRLVVDGRAYAAGDVVHLR